MAKWVKSVVAVIGLGGMLALAGCGGGAHSGRANPPASPTMSAMAAVGEKIFKDVTLSKNGNQACASCHAANQGHAGAPLAQLGTTHVVELGSDGRSLGGRMAPSIRYLSFNKAFRIEADGTPTGGFFWDGRAASLAEQAKGPFLNPAEMANDSAADVVAKLAQRDYAADFKAVFGGDIFNDTDKAFERVALALQAYQKEDVDFAPFSSKYDAFLRGQTALTDTELRGLAWFNSASKGNCLACHPSARGADGRFPLFTDFSYDSLGVPRNWAESSTWGDLGLCASAALDGLGLSDTRKAGLCGTYKVPSLRNVGLRKAYFHNGRFTNLTDVVTFYVQRDTDPGKWYRKQDGSEDTKFNDLPAYAANVNTTEAPYNRNVGDAPALSDAEIAEVVAFLCTLTDGWSAGANVSCNR